MKKLYPLLLLGLLISLDALGQCSGGTARPSITPTLSWQTVAMSSGDYRPFAATAGNTYAFSLCGNGGSAGFDSQLTLLTNSGAYGGAYSDDACGTASEISWTCTSSGTYRVLLNDYYCLSSGNAATLAYRQFVPGPGATCGNPHVIGSLPFTATGLTTCGAGNDYTSADACGSIYMNGEDYVFRYVASGAQTIRITLSNTLSFTGVFVVENCPSAGNANCIAANAGGCGGGGLPNESSSGNPVAEFTLPGAGTYYFIVDTWPSPNCTGFDINVQTVAGSGGGPGCGSYTISTPSYAPDNFNSGTQLSFPDDEFSNAVSLPFTFCFMGTNYTSLVVSSNAYVSFTTACAAQYSGWDTDVIPAPASTNSPEARNSIMFPWVDVDPSIGGSIRYNTYGTAPNRRFVVAFRNVPMFETTCNSLTYTGQVVIYETTFVIDIFIQNLPNCAVWNDGEAVLGLLDASGTVAVPVPGYNNTAYTLSNFARRFTPNCPTCGILPVTFTHLSGIHESQLNRVSWTTGHEVNSASFTLERSRDGQQFETVGTLPGAGTEPMGRTYQMEDRGRYAPATFYRVVQRDVNGAETISDVIMVAANSAGLGITSAVPRDGQLLLNLQNANAAQPVRIEILDVLGKSLYTASMQLDAGANQRTVEIAHLSAGVYFLKVSGAQGATVMRKFVKD
jgi:hypothetical protein